MERLKRRFFERPPEEVAPDLLGKIIFFRGLSGIICETEAYGSQGEDAASHAYRGATERSKIMFAEAGFSYVYLIYGIHHCLNFTAKEPGRAGAVLIRGIITGNANRTNLDGPGKLCSFLGISRKDNGIDITKDPNFYLTENPGIKDKVKYIATPRIGIKKGLDKYWRFWALDIAKTRLQK